MRSRKLWPVLLAAIPAVRGQAGLGLGLWLPKGVLAATAGPTDFDHEAGIAARRAAVSTLGTHGTILEAERLRLRVSQEPCFLQTGTMTGQWLPREQVLVAEGNAIDEIVAAAIKLDADLIVMGLSRAGELGPRVDLTANRISTVVCRSRKVVLVARPNAATTHILAASDFTDAEYPALHYASLLADWLDVELTFLHHVNPSQASFTALSCAALLQSRPPDLTCLRSQAARARIDRLAAHFGTGIETVVTEGDDTAGKILAEAAIRKADILVVGAHGTSFIQRWLHHPVGIELIEQATASVFVVPLSKTRMS